MMNTIDVLATLQLTFPKQYECVFWIFSKIIRNNEMTEMKKNTNAGVHNERIRVITSIRVGICIYGMYGLYGLYGLYYIYIYRIIYLWQIYLIISPGKEK